MIELKQHRPKTPQLTAEVDGGVGTTCSGTKAAFCNCAITGVPARLETPTDFSVGIPGRSALMTHVRNRLAFNLLAKATEAIDTPGRRHAAITFALNLSLCLRRALAAVHFIDWSPVSKKK